MRIFRDFLLELLIAVVVGGVNTVLIILQQLPPLYLFLIITAITFAIILGTVKWYEKRLKKRLGIEQQRWDKIRKEKIRLRQPYANRTEIPKLLFDMFECSSRLVEAHASQDDFSDKLLRIANKLDSAGFLSSNSPFLRRLASIKSLKNPFGVPTNIPKLKQIEPGIINFLLGMQGAMKIENIGALQVSESDTEYQKLLSRVHKLQIGLPSKINTKINGHVQIASSMTNLSYFDLYPSVSPGISIALPYLKPNIYNYIFGLNSEISTLIEKFLLGDDIK